MDEKTEVGLYTGGIRSFERVRCAKFFLTKTLRGSIQLLYKKDVNAVVPEVYRCCR
jgi:hypothetical protein